jgi:predicted nucleic acid-binding protein
MIVLDTNVLSEALRPAPAPGVLAWLAALEPAEAFTTAVTQAEMLHGVEMLPAGKRRSVLERALEALFGGEFSGRVLPFDERAAQAYAKVVRVRQTQGRPISQFDAMIAAICLSRRATLATRNVADFEDCGVRLVNPWS